MAPFVPEELDVFTIPHSRMKELVSGYVEKLERTNFSDYVDMQLLLQSLSEAFEEFKKHEQIENNLIMKKLKNKLKQLSIKNTAVCNCHKDSHLTEILHLVEDGYTKKTVQDRVNYGLQLRKKLEAFTEEFLPHMKQEEEVFQPLLLQHFTYGELCDLRSTVIKLHLETKDDSESDPWQFLKNLKVDLALTDSEASEKEDEEKDEYCKYMSEKPEKQQTATEEKEVTCIKEVFPTQPTCRPGILDLPHEVMLNVMSYLTPLDLGVCGQVCHDWLTLSRDPLLWKQLHPVRWARGEWDYQLDATADMDESDEEEADDGQEYILVDEDADVDESSYSEDDSLRQIREEAKLLSGLVKHVLPAVGQGVKVLNLAHSKSLTSALLHRVLKLCPNIEYLDLTQTKISDSGLKSLGKNYCGSQLKKVVLSGCVNITDSSLMRLAVALSQPAIVHDVVAMETNDAVPAALIEVNGGHSEDKLKEAQVTDVFPKDNVRAHESTDSVAPLIIPKQVHDIENLPMMKKSEKGDEDAQLQQMRNAGLVQIADDFCLCAEYFDTRRRLAWCQAPCWPQSQLPKIFKPSLPKGRRKGGGGCEGRASSAGKPPCCDTNGGPCCREGVVDDTVPGSKNGSNLSQQTQPMPADDIPSSVVARDKPHGNITALKSDSCQVSVMGMCHTSCCDIPTAMENSGSVAAEEACVTMKASSHRSLQYLSVSGCHQVTDLGLSSLAGCGPFPDLWGLDLSGCPSLTGAGIEVLVDKCPSLDPQYFYYCDNITDGPLVDTASGCRNQGCGARYCCRRLITI